MPTRPDKLLSVDDGCPRRSQQRATLCGKRLAWRDLLSHKMKTTVKTKRMKTASIAWAMASLSTNTKRITGTEIRKSVCWLGAASKLRDTPAGKRALHLRECRKWLQEKIYRPEEQNIMQLECKQLWPALKHCVAYFAISAAVSSTTTTTLQYRPY